MEQYGDFSSVQSKLSFHVWITDTECLITMDSDKVVSFKLIEMRSPCTLTPNHQKYVGSQIKHEDACTLQPLVVFNNISFLKLDNRLPDCQFRKLTLL